MNWKAIALFGALAFASGSSAQAQSNPNPNGIDPEHYQCYTITEAAGFTGAVVSLKDQFGGVRGVKVGPARFLCAPVSKNGEVLADARSHLVCYSVTGGTQNVGKRVETVNQFGKMTLTVVNSTLLCVPSFKRVLLQ